MNLFEEFLSQVGIFVNDPEDINYTIDYSEFTVVDGEEGDYGIVKYYDGESLLAIRIVAGGDAEETHFTSYAKEILGVKAMCWLEKALIDLPVFEKSK